MMFFIFVPTDRVLNLNHDDVPLLVDVPLTAVSRPVGVQIHVEIMMDVSLKDF